MGEHTRTDLINEKTEQTVVTHSQIRVVQPALIYRPLVQAPIQPPPRLMQIRAIRVVRDPEPETQISAPIYMMLLFGFAIFGYFGYQWHSNSATGFSYLTNLLKMPSLRSAATSEYAEIVLNSPSGPSQVIVNNQLQSSMTPLRLRLLKNRPYQIEMSSPGFIPRHFSFIPAKDAQYMVSLEPLPRIMPQRQIASVAPVVVPKKQKRPAGKVAKNTRKK
jgi:hypothetical protein